MSLTAQYRTGYLSSVSGSPLTYDAAWQDTSEADSLEAAWDAKSGSAFVQRNLSWVWTPSVVGSNSQKHIVLAAQYVFPVFDSGFIASLLNTSSGEAAAVRIDSALARAKMSATRGGSPLVYGIYKVDLYVVCKILDASDALRFSFEVGYNSGASPGLSTLTALPWGAAQTPLTNSLFHTLPAAGDKLVIEMGFRLMNPASNGSAVTFNIQTEFGDSSATDLTTGATIQGNSKCVFRYYSDNASSGNIRAGYIKPLAPSMTPVQMSPIITQPVSTSTITNIARTNSRRAGQ